MANKFEVTREDIISMNDYKLIRAERRKVITDIKSDRRINVGSDATFYFENYDTILHQILEMLWIEKGGDEQIGDELSAYNPLIPDGRELVSTLMFEIDDPERRASILSGLGGVEKKVLISIGQNEKIFATAEEDLDRTTAGGKASAVQFLHFEFSDRQVELFKDPGVDISIGITHQNYNFHSIIPKNVRSSLFKDFS